MESSAPPLGTGAGAEKVGVDGTRAVLSLASNGDVGAEMTVAIKPKTTPTTMVMAIGCILVVA